MQERVIDERIRRGWSIREAAAHGGVSNTTWARYEQTGNLTGRMRQAVALAYSWTVDWPDTPDTAEPATAPEPDDELTEIASKVDRLADSIDAVLATTADRRDVLRRNTEIVEQISAAATDRGDRIEIALEAVTDVARRANEQRTRIEPLMADLRTAVNEWQATIEVVLQKREESDQRVTQLERAVARSMDALTEMADVVRGFGEQCDRVEQRIDRVCEFVDWREAALERYPAG